MNTSAHEVDAREPSIQISTPRVVSASAETMTISEVNAEKSWVAATPASMILSVVPPARRANPSIIAKAATPPMKAPVSDRGDAGSETMTRRRRPTPELMRM